VSSVSVGFQSKKSLKNGIFEVLVAPGAHDGLLAREKWGEDSKRFRGVSEQKMSEERDFRSFSRHFSRGQNFEIPFFGLFCSETPQKRLLRRL